MTEGKGNANERYQAALQLLGNAEQLLWLVFGALLLTHSVLLGFLAESAVSATRIAAWHPGKFAVSFVGLLMCVPWFAAYFRGAGYYYLRIAQAREFEPEGMNLLRGPGERFADGHEVQIGQQSLQLACISRIIKSRWAIPGLIWLFVVAYIILIALTGPWWPLESTAGK